jgi:hypothetical protein
MSLSVYCLDDRPTEANLGLSEVQRQELERVVRAGTAEKRMVFRARLILECASGVDNVQVASA